MTYPLTGYDAIYTILKQLRDDIKAEMQRINHTLDRVGIVPGAIAWDACDTCGQLALAVHRNYLSINFPQERTMTEIADPPQYLCADIVVQAIRCVPTVSESGAPPSTTALDNSAQDILIDASAVLCTVNATLSKMESNQLILDWMIRQQVYVGPQGACAGSELVVVVGIQL